MKSSHLLQGVLFVGLTALTGTASAGLTTTGIQTASIDFQGMNGGPTGYYGKANIAANVTEGCNTLTTKCYFEDGFSVGTVIDPADSGAHLHRGGNAATRLIEYHGDSGGIYVRADDLSAFSLNSFVFDSRDLTGSNPAAGEAASYFEVLGFNSALNSDLTTWNWKTDPTYAGKRVAYQTVANSGNLNTILLNSSFNNIEAFWIHYVNYPKVPTDGVEFDIKLGAIQLSAPVAAVPLPAATYLFGTGLMGLLAFGKKRRSI